MDQTNKDKIFIAEKEIFILGLNRSGQHGVMAWITGMLDQVILKNDMLKHQLYESSFEPYFNYYQNYMSSHAILMSVSPIRQREIDAIIFGGENHTPYEFAKWYKNRFSRYRKNKIRRMFGGSDASVALSKERYFITVLRSPYNHAASALKWKKFTYHPINDPRIFIPWWKEYAKEHLGITNYMSDLPGKHIYINYDRWFSEEAYRREIAAELGLEYNENKLNTIMRAGRGSSFGKQRYNGKAQLMPVSDRWKFFMGGKQKYKKRYLMLLKDDELIELSEKIFGPMPEEIKNEICDRPISA